MFHDEISPPEPAADSIEAADVEHGELWSMSELLFPLGKIVATPAAIDALDAAGHNPGEFLERHAWGDWGDCDPADME